MFSVVLLLQRQMGTPVSGTGGYDVIIILGCLGVLTGMVYLFKFLLEKYGIARNKRVFSGHSVDSIEDRKA
jgi:hypothetical protein